RNVVVAEGLRAGYVDVARGDGRPGGRAAHAVQEPVPERGGGDPGERGAARAFRGRRSRAAIAVAVEEIDTRTEEPPVLNLQDDRDPQPPGHLHERKGVPGQVMTVQQLRSLLFQQALEVALQEPV